MAPVSGSSKSRSIFSAVGPGSAPRASNFCRPSARALSARHLQERIEVLDRREAAQPTREARATTPAQHGEGIEDGAVADKIEHRVELFGFSDPLRKLRSLRFDALCAKLSSRATRSRPR